MLAETHGSIGWLIGLFSPASDRRLRNWCALAATAPDIDALTYLGGQAFYEHWHRTFGHNAFLGLFVTGMAVRAHRDHPLARRLLVAGDPIVASCPQCRAELTAVERGRICTLCRIVVSP